MALGTGVGIIWHRIPGIGGGGSSCPTASTSELDGTPSRLFITSCFCDVPAVAGEGNLWDNLSLDVDGDTSTWTITGIEDYDGDKCVTWIVSGGPLSYGQAIQLIYDHSGTSPWGSMTGDVSISVSNTIAESSVRNPTHAPCVRCHYRQIR